MPSAVELEQAVVGAIMAESSAFSKVESVLTEDMFYSSQCGTIFKAAKRLHDKEEAIDMLTVSNEIEKLGLLDLVGGKAGIVELAVKVTSSIHIDTHAAIIKDKYIAREAMKLLTSSAEKAASSVEDVRDVIAETEVCLSKLTDIGITNDYIHVSKSLEEAYEEINKAASSTGDISGIPSGFEDLDRMTSGWQSSDLVILAGRPAMGKTALAICMGLNMATNYNIPFGIFSLEMSSTQLTKRMISIASSINGETIKNGKLADYQWESLDQAINKISNAPIYVDDTAFLDIQDLKAKARKMVEKDGVKIIIIDYLQLVGAKTMGSRQEQVAYVSRQLKGLAKELNIPIIALSQLNRGIESREGSSKKPQLSDLRESGAIEQDADIVFFVHRPEYYGITIDDNGNNLRGIAELIIAKHRNGATGEVSLRFEGEFTRFSNLHDIVYMPTEDEVPF